MVILACLNRCPYRKIYYANPWLDIYDVILIISKAFDRVWHEAIIFKFWSYGISDILFCLFDNFLSERLQRVVLNCQSFEFRKVLARVPQGWILGLLLILNFMNDIRDNLEYNVKIFTDKTYLFALCPKSKLGKTWQRLRESCWVGILMKGVIQPRFVQPICLVSLFPLD